MLAHYCRFIDKAALTKPDPFAVPVIELSPTVAVTFMGSVPVDHSDLMHRQAARRNARAIEAGLDRLRLSRAE